MKRITILFFALVVTATGVLAQIPERPQPERLVNDFANVLSDSEQQNMESALHSFHEKHQLKLL